MKYKVGDKIKIVRATFGCCGAEGKIGVITNKPATYGLADLKDGFNVDCGNGHVWRIGFRSECELLGELTAEEAIKALGDMCARDCADCELGKHVKESKHAFCSDYRREHPDKVVEILKQWKKDHEKKDVEVEFVNIVQVIEDLGYTKKCVYEEDVTEVKDETFKMTMKRVLKEYCKEHEGKFFTVYEEICRVKE